MNLENRMFKVMGAQMTMVETEPYKKFNPFWIVTVLNGICRWSYKTQSRFLKMP